MSRKLGDGLGMQAHPAWDLQLRRILQSLREIDRAILDSASDLGATLDTILAKSLELIGARYGNLMLVEGDQLVIEATTTRPKEKEIGTRLPIDDSVSGLPVLRRKGVVIPDVEKQKQPPYRRILTDEYMRSELLMPLMVDDDVIGVLNVESPQEDAFTSHHKDLLETLAGQAAIALELARRQEDLLRRQEELQSLREIDRAILDSASDLDATLDTILAKSLELIGARYGNLMLVEGDQLVIEATTTRPKEKEIGTRLPIDDSVSGLPVLRRKGVVIPDVEKQKQPPYRRILTDEYMRSELLMPLMVDDDVIGVLNVESPQEDAFTSHHKDLLETLAGQAAIALELARRQEDLLRRQEELQSLREIDRAILDSASDLDATLNTILTKSLELVDADRGGVALVEEGDEMLVVRASIGTDDSAPLGYKFGVHSSVCGLAVLSRTPILIDNTSDEPLYRCLPGLEPMGAELVVPLIADGDVIGVLNMESRRPYGFSKRHCSTLEALAGQAAIAIRNAHLYEQLEEKQQELGKIERIRGIGEAAAITVHDYAGWAAAILGSLERIERVIPSSNASSLEDIRWIREIAEAMISDKERVLGPARELELELAKINEIISNCLRFVDAPDDVHVRLDQGDDLLYAFVDAAQLSRVFQNLIKNAIQAMEGIMDRPKVLGIRVRKDPDGLKIRVEVSDTGHGIPEEGRDLIWVPGKSLRRDGTGWGLAGCQRVLRAMNSDIYLHWTEPDVGTTFVVLIPLPQGLVEDDQHG